jgi:hypothetical protein
MWSKPMIFLTEDEHGHAGPDIEADTWEEAEAEVERIRQMWNAFAEADLVVAGELVARTEVDYEASSIL